MEGKKIAAYVAGAVVCVVCVAGGMLAEHYGNVVSKAQNLFKGKKEEEVASPQAQAQMQNQEPVAKPMQNQQKA